ncbi:Ricin-type beta-trefoil lectin domain-like [Parafrankia irregularis]|uniref:Ricin-type beta-trefoil lectin domain-like n=1 Tax=Parafrankia irregularis TaxID=795642 RepID=A0A0S4QRW5_9ACTN|nr:Ricin-type beta-trefoil lectin domain-like [Parafrankia irregularis]
MIPLIGILITVLVGPYRARSAEIVRSEPVTNRATTDGSSPSSPTPRGPSPAASLLSPVAAASPASTARSPAQLTPDSRSPTAPAPSSVLPEPRASAAPPPQAPDPTVPIDSPVRVVNHNSGLCLAVPGASTNTYVDLNQFGCGDFPDTYWRIDPWSAAGGGQVVYRIVNNHSGFCAAVPGASVAVGANVNQYLCGNYPDHFWRIEFQFLDSSRRPLYRIINNNSGLCLAVRDGDTRQTAPVIQTVCGDRPEQYWRFGGA